MATSFGFVLLYLVGTSLKGAVVEIALAWISDRWMGERRVRLTRVVVPACELQESDYPRSTKNLPQVENMESTMDRRKSTTMMGIDNCSLRNYRGSERK